MRNPAGGWKMQRIGHVRQWLHADAHGGRVAVVEPYVGWSMWQILHYGLGKGQEHFSNADSGKEAFAIGKRAVEYYSGRAPNRMGKMHRANPSRGNPRPVSDEKAIRAFLSKTSATSKQLSSDGATLSLHWPRAVIAAWVGGQIHLGTPYGNVSQSYIRKVARLAPAYLIARDSWWALPAKTVAMLKREGR